MQEESAHGVVVVVDRSRSSVEVGIGRRRQGLGNFVVLSEVDNSVVLSELGSFGVEGRCWGVGYSCSCSAVGLNWRVNVV